MPDLTEQLPSALRTAARWTRLGDAQVPTMLVHPGWDSGRKVPIILWMHGRTVTKEIDPGRYLRWMRAGIGACAIDLPGHGERFDADLQRPENTLKIVEQMASEIDDVLAALHSLGQFDLSRPAVGGMSAGGMATLLRLCSEHTFCCASVEATTGSWAHQREREMFRNVPVERIEAKSPIRNLKSWREIPFQAIHTRHDEWVAFDGQQAFIKSLQQRYHDPSLIEFHTYDRTGAPFEHAGFGRMSADAKDRQSAFFRKWLLVGPENA
ncbi:MAG TPA: alpha/beta fold hydrolase [Phycisphaerales bacterium]|nr:alpha/beta fold hydrolase [Phycisphaerales bacterium]HRQ75111.1 alpha/beta fold hydrolase [Phycisphaerales bacterium]